ncbi:MAG: galactose mutarotase [Woeseia sp.]|nr:galactose mutarotase [Woeseia sp.]
MQTSMGKKGVEDFGRLPDGRQVQRLILENASGMRVAVINYGAIVQEVLVPDRDGGFADVVLGFDDIEGYLGPHPYFGALVGRYANRIARGKFSIGGSDYTLATNNGPNAIHGGIKGFDKAFWEIVPEASSDCVVLRYVSADGEEGFPGELTVTVTYTLTDDNQLRIDYEAVSTRPTPVNFTNHSYFNLAGAGNGDVLDHVVTINADHFTPVDETLIPTGELRSVAGTPFDFRQATAIGERIDDADTQLDYGLGYDHNWVLNRESESPTLAASVCEPTSGRVMQVYTTEPGLQFYTANNLDGSDVGKGGSAYHRRYAFCMETQHFPDSPNRPEFPSTILSPGETCRTTTIYQFGCLPRAKGILDEP